MLSALKACGNTVLSWGYSLLTLGYSLLSKSYSVWSRKVNSTVPNGLYQLPSSQNRFDKSTEDVMKLPQEPDNHTKLRLYGLYKQATMGDVTGNRPSRFDFVGAAKYDAWAEHKGMDKDVAMGKYADVVYELLKSAGIEVDNADEESCNC